MDIDKLSLENVEMYSHGRMNFMVGLCERLNLPEIFNSNLEKVLGRKSDIPYGILAEMMIVNICDDHHPLFRLREFYDMTDLEGIFHFPISINQINDDRFGKYLDAFYKTSPRKIFGEISSIAFSTFGIEMTAVNFDTTSKVMWGTYETEEGKEGVINIDFGHSKQKRDDKKQIKMGIGVANGVIVDAKVLSGNKDDKTYNGEVLEEVENVLERHNISKDDFYYIADSALFTSENLEKAKKRELKLITRMPDTTNLAKQCIRKAIDCKDNMKSFDLKNSKGETSEYFLLEKECTYENTPLKVVVCYSKNLEATKKRTIDKQIIKEKEVLLKLEKTYLKRCFACEEDATAEISKLLNKELKKIKFHNVNLKLNVIEKNKRGRKPKDASKIEYIHEYYVNFDLKEDENKIKRQFEEACTFVLCSTDLSLTGEEILTEYKTQSSVEKKFQQLKSPHFVNSLYLDTPERIEALTYMILISMMVLSIAEYVVRRELKATGKKIIGPGGVKMSQPTLWAILLIFSVGIGVKVLSINGKKYRSLARPLKDNHKRILECLSIPESIFCWQG